MTLDPSAAVSFAADTAKQLITLSTGIIALTLTYASGPGKAGLARARRLLIASWLLFLTCILFGVGTLMAITGNVALGQYDVYGSSIGFYFMLQISCFVAGIIVAMAYGIVVTRPAAAHEPKATSADAGASEPSNPE